jgi:glycosyltransferase involved in cell wall biosynthesis
VAQAGHGSAPSPSAGNETATPNARPFFSLLITAYNRPEQIERCVGSCTRQTFRDFEIVVVDDASSDGTAATLASIDEPRLRVVTHPRNRGISPARATAVDHARGEWLVMLDSDWELLPESLARLRSLIDELPPGVRIIRSRLLWDNGVVSPVVLPTETVTDYRGRLQWLDAMALDGGSSDAGHCMHRSVFEIGNYFRDRRGAVEPLWELNLARQEASLWVSDVLGLQHDDAANSFSRDASSARLVPRLLAEACDSLWMAQTTLAEHGADLAHHAPHYRVWLLKGAVLDAFLCGDRLAGVRLTWAAARAGARDPKLAATLLLGMVGPQTLARAKAAGRLWRTGRRSKALRRHEVP